MKNLPSITKEMIDTPEDKLRKSLLIFACAFMNLAVG